MRILILGQDYSAKQFFSYFSKNKENIVFSTIKNSKNYVQHNSIQDILDFCEANEINLVVIINNDLINQGVGEAISAINISVFAPSIDAIGICSSKSYAKKFMHKNKILTPKFFIAEKAPIALDYLKNNKQVQAIKPDYNSFKECTKFCETRYQAEKVINNLFASGNERIILEDYIVGKSINVWTISNGYDVQIIGTSVNYQNNIALFNPDFIDENLKEKMLNEAIVPTIQALSNQDEEYVGILGFNFILTSKNEIYLTGYDSFFDDMNVDFYLNCFGLRWEEIFNHIIIEDVFQICDLKSNNEYMLAIRQNEKIELITSRTKNGIKKHLEELDFDLKEYNEAEKVWKY